MPTHGDSCRQAAWLSLAGLLAVCCAPAGCTKAGPPQWKTTAVDARFSFEMPGDPRVQSQTQDSPAGSLRTEFFELPLDNGARVYSFMITELPSMLAEPKGDEIEKRLEGAQQGALANSKGKLLKSEKMRVAGYSARDCLIEIPGVGLGRMRVVWVHRTLVVMEVVNVNSKDADRFFDSLKLLKDSSAPEPAKPQGKP